MNEDRVSLCNGYTCTAKDRDQMRKCSGFHEGRFGLCVYWGESCGNYDLRDRFIHLSSRKESKK